MSKSETNTWRTGANQPTYHAQHDWATTEPLSTTVMTAIAEAMDEDPADIGPLYERFDPDALDGLFSPRAGGTPRTGGHVAFTFEGYHVFIQSDGHITVHLPEERT